MLVSFSVENYKSFAAKQTLSLVAGKAAQKEKKYAFKSKNSLAPHLLRGACLFGANGAGKSSFIEALDFFYSFVRNSAQNMQEGDLIDVKPHLFDEEFAKAPSEFEIVFIHEDALYQYGFSADKHRVWQEWLYSKPNDEKTRMRMLFYREYDKHNDGYEWKINDTFIRGQKDTWKSTTRANGLFLSQAVQLNAQDLKLPFQWIQRYFKIIGSPQRLSRNFTAHQYLKEGKRDEILKFLNSVDIRISDLDIKSKTIDIEDLPPEIPRADKEAILKQIKGMDAKTIKINTLHKTKSGVMVPLPMDEESDGTNVLFGLAGPWLDVLENGYTLVVDELHNSLHPHAFKTIIEFFCNPKINKNNAQLIFTSHETSIMSAEIIHQDQIWLVEKTDDESSELIPLSDYSPRTLNSFQKSYLNGRYGGVPKIGEFDYGQQ